MRLLLVEQPPSQPVIHKDAENAQRHPQQAERQADLSQQVAGQARVVPDAEAQI